MKKILPIILVISLICISFFAGKHYGESKNKTFFNDSSDVKIEKIIIKNDSILKVNDSINIKVIEVEKVYEKTVNDIILNSTDDDYRFFANYIERYCGYYYSDSIKNYEFDIR